MTAFDTPDRWLPFDGTAEEALIGCATVDPEKIIPLIASVPGDDLFYIPANRTIYGAMASMQEADMPIDAVTLTSFLHQSGDLDAVGGAIAVSRLTQLLPTAANAKFYLKLVTDKQQLRRIITTATDLVSKAHDSSMPMEDVQEQVELALHSLIRSSNTIAEPEMTWKQAINAARDHYEAVCLGTKEPGLSTGLGSLDRIIGGMVPGDMICIAGESGGGKTALALQIAGRLALKGERILVFTLEMTQQMVIDRLVSNIGGVNLTSLRMPEWPAHMIDRAGAALHRIAALDIIVRDDSDMTPTQMRSIAREANAKKHVGLIVLDYLQLVSPEKANNEQNREREVAKTSMAAKAMSKEIGCPVIVLSQLNENGKVRDSRQIFFDAKLALKILPTEDCEVNTRKLLIAKNTNGPSGDVITLAWNGQHVRFDDLSTKEQPK